MGTTTVRVGFTYLFSTKKEDALGLSYYWLHPARSTFVAPEITPLWSALVAQQPVRGNGGGGIPLGVRVTTQGFVPHGYTPQHDPACSAGHSHACRFQWLTVPKLSTIVLLATCLVRDPNGINIGKNEQPVSPRGDIAYNRTKVVRDRV